MVLWPRSSGLPARSSTMALSTSRAGALWGKARSMKAASRARTAPGSVSGAEATPSGFAAWTDASSMVSSAAGARPCAVTSTSVRPNAGIFGDEVRGERVPRQKR